MKLKTSVAAMCAVGLMGVLPAAHADLFTFDSNGAAAGGAVGGAAFIDQLPGNNLAIGGTVAGGPPPVGSGVSNLYQANLNSINAANGAALFTNGAGGSFFTFVAQFNETVIGNSTGGGATTANFAILPGGTFKMCAQSALGNDLAGTGFSCAGNGILSATATGGFATQTGFAALLAPLDSSPNGNQRGTTASVTSAGAATLNLRVTFADPNYFPDLVSGTGFTLSFANTSLVTPFNQVDPSLAFSSNTIANGDTPDNIGPINGISGPNFQFQADANQSFVRVPEPGTLALLGLGALVGGFARRRKVA